MNYLIGCGDCLAQEGELHEAGCDHEICPICKRQLLSCQKHTWEDFKDNEREPFFQEVSCCARCSETMPDLFMVSNEEWEKICGVTFNKEDILCSTCIEFITSKRGIKLGEKNE